MKSVLRRAIGICSFLTLLFFAFSPESNSFLKGDINDDGKIDLNEAIYSLQIVSGQKTAYAVKTINVPGDFGTIQEGINAASAGDTINIASGTFNEILSISKDNIVVQGSGKDTTIIKGNGTNPTIFISNSRNIQIKDLQIRDGSYGIRIDYSSLTCSGIRVENNPYGLRAYYNSYVKIEDSVFKFSSSAGIRISRTSSAYLSNNDISQNTSNGIQVTDTSSASLDNNKISNNNGSGIQVAQGSSISLTGNEVKSNSYSGIDVTGHSMAGLWGGNIISENCDNSGWRAGVGIAHASEVTIGFSTTKDVISSNKGPGIFVANSSSLFLQSGTVSNNQGSGVSLRFDSVGQFDLGASIVGNTGYGIGCGDQGGTDSKYWGTVGDFGSIGPPDTRNLLGDKNCQSL